MNNYRFSTELEDIYYKYERLKSLIAITQMSVEAAGLANVPEEFLSNALFEIELEVSKTNDRLKAFMGGGKDNA